MRRPFLTFVLGTLFAMLSLLRPNAQTAVSIPADLSARIASGGSVRVIVGTAAAFVPDGALAGADEISAKRAQARTAVEGVMTRASAAGVGVGQPFDYVPFFTAEVDASALAALAALPGVTSIEIDAVERPLLAESAALIGAPVAWAAGATGAGWTVAVIDTGVDRAHPFLAGKVVSEACYSNAGGLGVPSNGSTSICAGGATSVTGPGTAAPCTAALGDCDHGTHMAGIIAGTNGPGGASGIAPGASILAVQVFSRFSDPVNCPGANPCVLSFTSDQIRGLERALALAGPNNTGRVAAAVIALGAGQFDSTSACDAQQGARKAAIDNLRAIGVPTIIASGNSGFTTAMTAPACISSAVSVGSSSKTDEMSDFTNRPAFLSLLAPGLGIASSVPGGSYAALSGTSMAAAHVAGAWAILKQAVPAASVTQVLAAFRANGRPISDPAGVFPRINVPDTGRALLAAANVTAGAPGTPVVAGNDTSVRLRWTAPTTGGIPTGYTVIARSASNGPEIARFAVGNVLSSTVVAPPGAYFVSVVATNGRGAGVESPGVAVGVPIVPPPPGLPYAFGATVSGSTVTLSWVTPQAGGDPGGYIITARPVRGGALIATLPYPAGTGLEHIAVIAGVPRGTYHVEIVATNLGGVGPENEFTVIVP